MAFQQRYGPLMGMSFLEFRGAKQFFRKDCFFLWRWVAFGSGFCGVLLAVGHNFPYPQRLFRRERLGDEKKVLRRTALYGSKEYQASHPNRCSINVGAARRETW